METVKLGLLIKKTKVARCGNFSYPVLSITKQDGIIMQSEKFKKRIASADTSDYKIIPRGKLVQGIHIDEGNFGIQDIVDNGIVSPAYGVWDVNDELVVPKYLEMVLRSPKSIEFYRSKLTGTVSRRGHMSDTDFLSMDVPFPDKDTQSKILETMKQTTSVLCSRQQQLAKLDELVKARFVEMFGTYPDNPFGWNTGKIQDVVSDVRYGSSRPAVEGGKYPYLRMNNITYAGELDLTDTKRIDVPDNELDKCTVRRGDVLFNRTNSKELVGKTCVYNRDDMMVLAGFVIRVRVNERILPEFLVAFLNTDFSKQMLLGMCKTAIGQANINAKEMQNIGLYIPPIALQEQFVDLKNQIDKSKLLATLFAQSACILAENRSKQKPGGVRIDQL